MLTFVNVTIATSMVSALGPCLAKCGVCKGSNEQFSPRLPENKQRDIQPRPVIPRLQVGKNN